MASFKISTRISHSLEAFLLLRIKISRLISSDETKLKVNNSGCALFEDLIFSMLIWMWWLLMMSSESFDWGDFFKLSCL